MSIAALAAELGAVAAIGGGDQLLGERGGIADAAGAD
jgi:hypothetical protein